MAPVDCLITAWKNMMHNRVHSIDNLSGLYVALAGAILTGFYPRNGLGSIALRIFIQVQLFVFACLPALVIALLTTGWQSLRAALANRAESIEAQ